MPKPKTKQYSLRLPITLLDQLKKEAEKDHRTLANYIEMLIINHPSRKDK